MERKTITLNLNAKKYLTNLLWVLKAKSSCKNRIQLNYLNIDNYGYCCTDGKRLHLIKGKEGLPSCLENGLYNVIISKDIVIFQPEEGTFPDYQAIIPADKENPLKVNIGSDNVSFSCALTLISCKVLNGENSINYDFIKDLSGEDWIVSGEVGKGIKFVARDKLAIVMPLRLN